MALKSFRVTKKEILNFYNPKSSEYQWMVDSNNSPMGYGQVIQKYDGNQIFNTWYHVYDYEYGAPVVYETTSGVKSTVENAGMTFWATDSTTGIDFLNGLTSITGLRKLKYCNNCSDGNGLNKPVIENFKQRFIQVNQLVLGYNLLEGFLFYDLSLPKYQNVFPSIKIDDGVNITYQFKDVTTGADLTAAEVSTITQKPVSEIETSVNDAIIVKPQEGSNTVITSCCDESITHVIIGQYTVGSVLYTEEVFDSKGSQKLYCWFVESQTKDLPTLPVSTTFTSGGRSCQVCTKLHPCPTYCDTLYLTFSTDPSTACEGNPIPYDYDGVTLYLFEDCGGTTASAGYYGDGKMIYFWDGDTLSEYQTCPSGGNSIIQGCCDGTQYIIGQTFSVGTVVYTKELTPAVCFEVIGNTTDSPDAPFSNVTVWGGVGCAECTRSYSGGCK